MSKPKPSNFNTPRQPVHRTRRDQPQAPRGEGQRDDRRPYGGRDERAPYGQRPQGDRPQFNRDRNAGQSGQPRQPFDRDRNAGYGDRTPRQGDDRGNRFPPRDDSRGKPFAPRGEGQRDDRRPYGGRDERAPYGQRPQGDRPQFNRDRNASQGGQPRQPFDRDRNAGYGDRAPRQGDDRGNRFAPRDDSHGKQFAPRDGQQRDDRRPYGGRDERAPYGQRPQGDRPQFNRDRNAGQGDQPRQPFDRDRNAGYGDRAPRQGDDRGNRFPPRDDSRGKPFAPRGEGQRDDRRPYGGRDERAPYGQRPQGDRPQFNRDRNAGLSGQPRQPFDRDRNAGYGDRAPRQGDDRGNRFPPRDDSRGKPFAPRGEGQRDDRRPYGGRDERAPYGQRPQGDRPQFNRDRNAGQGGQPRQPYDRDQKPAYGDRPQRQRDDSRGDKPARAAAPDAARGNFAPQRPTYIPRVSMEAPRARKLQVRAMNDKLAKQAQQLREKRIETKFLPDMRLQKALAVSGLGSRRDMEDWIAAGRVSVNGEVASLGARVGVEDKVRVDGKQVTIKWPDRLPRVIAYHKEEGEIVTRDDPEGRTTVFDRLPQTKSSKWVAVGRLDVNTSGLLIFTTSGELANRMTHPSFEVEREYAVRAQGELTPAQLREVVAGIELEDGMANFARISHEGGEGQNHWYRVVLKEGRNREVRRLFEHFGATVSRLIRVRFGIVGLPPRLKRGQFYELNELEVSKLMNWAGLTMTGLVKPR